MTVTSELPIGVFDSGLGGLDVAAAISQVLPQERLLYWGDNARVPYGTKSPQTVQGYTYEASHQLVKRGVKAIMIACNTASAVVDLERLSREVGVPVFGMIEAGVRACINVIRASIDTDIRTQNASDLLLNTSRIVVLATPGTVNSGAYQRALRANVPHAQISAMACPLFVPLVEMGWADHELTPRLVIAQLEESDVLERLKTDDESPPLILLGCTHYPLMASSIEQGISEGVGRALRCIDGAESAALMIKERLNADQLLCTEDLAHTPDASRPTLTQSHYACFTDDLKGSASLELASYFWSKRGGIGDLNIISVST
jgi:glutamate racemase